jgi:hypothetical protein
MRLTYGSGKPRAAHDRAAEVILMILLVMKSAEDLFVSWSAHFPSHDLVFANPKPAGWFYRQP